MPDRIRSDNNPNIYPPGQLESSNGRAILKVHDNGDVIVWAHISGDREGTGEAIWSTHTDGQPDCHFCMNDNGEVCMFKNGSSDTTWKSGSWNSGRPGPYTLVMQDDGNLVAYSSDGSAIWQSNSHVSPEPVEFAQATFVNGGHGVRCWPQVRSWNGKDVLWNGGSSLYWDILDGQDKTVNFATDTLDDNHTKIDACFPAGTVVSLGLGVDSGNADWVDPLRDHQFVYKPACGKRVVIRKYGWSLTGNAVYDGQQNVA